MDNLFKVEKLIKKYNEGTSIVDLQQELLDNNYDMTLLNELIDSYKVIEIADDKYIHIENTPYVVGKYVEKKYSSFVLVNNDSYNISNSDVCIDNDLVLINVTNKKSKTGEVIKILKREDLYIYGEVVMIKNNYFLDPESSKYKKLTISLDNNDNNLVVGSMVVVKIDGDVISDSYVGDVVSYIGLSSDPNIDILTEAWKLGVDNSFTDKAMEEVNNLPVMVRDIDKIGRCDLTDKQIFTIDGDDTKDIDDAVSIHRKPNGNYVLGVHIADVSYYVKEGSPLDNDAMERGTSVYLVDRVIPMLPHELSNGICSLNPNVSRLAISCVMEFDSHGKQIDYEIFESVIKSRIQMTYKKVNSILEKNIVPEGYEEYADSLRMMADLAQILRKAKENRGYIDFEVDEAKILVNEKCEPTEIVLRDRGVGENLIEDFMIAANECVATHIYFMNLPFIYRVHEVPKEEKIRSFLGFIGGLGYQINGNLKDNNPKSIQRLIKFLEDKKEFKILSKLLLRSMQKAVYKPVNLGHFGLASKCYTHFTSPIRRYPDTTVHRLLRTYLFQHKLDDNTISHWEDKLVYVADHSSAKERSSIDCEREVEDMKMAQYMEGHIGEEFEGMISSVMSFGIFVELDNLIEGLVSIKDMKGFFNYDEDRMTLTNEKSHVKYTIGERIKVRVIRASKEAKTIDFEIVKKV